MARLGFNKPQRTLPPSESLSFCLVRLTTVVLCYHQGAYLLCRSKSRRQRQDRPCGEKRAFAGNCKLLCLAFFSNFVHSALPVTSPDHDASFCGSLMQLLFLLQESWWSFAIGCVSSDLDAFSWPWSGPELQTLKSTKKKKKIQYVSDRHRMPGFSQNASQNAAQQYP